MALRHNHYEVAFEEYLRSLRRPYVAVDERRRALLANASLKSLDFIVYSERRPNLLVDVKGRRFPSGATTGGATGGAAGGSTWENWATTEDVDCLLAWEEVFGTGFRGLLVFAYEVLEPRWLPKFETRFAHGGRDYAYVGVWADEYRAEMTTRSRRWDTVSLPRPVYRRLRCPLSEVL